MLTHAFVGRVCAFVVRVYAVCMQHGNQKRRRRRGAMTAHARACRTQQEPRPHYCETSETRHTTHTMQQDQTVDLTSHENSRPGKRRKKTAPQYVDLTADSPDVAGEQEGGGQRRRPVFYSGGPALVNLATFTLPPRIGVAGPGPSSRAAAAAASTWNHSRLDIPLAATRSATAGQQRQPAQQATRGAPPAAEQEVVDDFLVAKKLQVGWSHVCRQLSTWG